MRRVPLRDRAAFNAAFLVEHYFPRSERVQRAKAVARLGSASPKVLSPLFRKLPSSRCRFFSASNRSLRQSCYLPAASLKRSSPRACIALAKVL